MVIQLNKKKKIQKLLLMAAMFSFILCILFVVWYFVSEIHFLEEKYPSRFPRTALPADDELASGVQELRSQFI